MSTRPSPQKRSKSAVALALLRRKDTHEEQSDAEDACQSTASPQPSAALPTPIDSASLLSKAKTHSAKPSSSSVHLSRITSTPSASARPPAPSNDKMTSLEQSVRKFRVVEALRSGDMADISKAIREVADGASRLSTSSRSSLTGGPLDDTTILHLAIQCAEFPVVEHILSDGTGRVDVNACDREGNTALHLAATLGRTQVVKLLLENKGINDAIANSQGKLPLDLARNPDIFQHLQLSRSIFAEAKVGQVRRLIACRDYENLAAVLEEPRLKTILDINSPEFASETLTVHTGGTLLHEAARRKDTQLIQVLLLHGADPFRRDRKGKLPQSVTSDDNVKNIIKKSPAAVAAQRGIQEKAVLGRTSAQGSRSTAALLDPMAGKEAREMKGYLKKWTNYRRGYQLRWFVLEDGVLSYYKHQDDAGSACRGAINMKIAKLHMSADEKTKFEIIGKSSVKYTLKANHEVEAKRWFWALNNSIQWTKDQAKEEERHAAHKAELLKQAKAEQSGSLSLHESHSESASLSDLPRSTSHLQGRPPSSVRARTPSLDPTGASTIGSMEEEEEEGREEVERFADAGTEANRATARVHRNGALEIPGEYDEEEEAADDRSLHETPGTSKDALNITAQSAKLQLETMAGVHAALLAEASHRPDATLSDTRVSQALSTYDAAIRSLQGLVGDLLRISRDRDAFWQYRLEREADMRRLWEESMQKVAREQEELEARIGEAESKRRLTKRALREMMGSGATRSANDTPTREVAQGEVEDAEARVAMRSAGRRGTALDQLGALSESDSGDEEEFFDAVDAGEVEVAALPHEHGAVAGTGIVISGIDISSSFRGYENGVRLRLKMDADDRPKISLWGILKSMIGKDMTKMTLPVSFNEPTSLLYRCCEDMEYADLLDAAADRADAIERLIYVAAFASSEYASTIGRVAKPFNPLLGETFEYVRPDKNYRFFIEQVSHHPPVGAAWAESPRWTYWGESAVKSKFYGKSFDINPLGTWFLKLRPTAGGKEELYTWKKVTSSVVGIITGNPTVDNYGLMEIKNWTTGQVATVDFKPRGWKASSAYHVSGKIQDADGKVRASLGGRWNSRIYARLTPGLVEAATAAGDKSGEEGGVHTGGMTDPDRAYLVWEANARPTGIPFNLTPFVLTLNHVDEKLRPWLAPTDSRLRPDQRAMEDGAYELAATEKNRLEENQRARRRAREARGEAFVPAWFSKAQCEVTGEEYWRFSGEYWGRRERAGTPEKAAAAWAGLEPIFDDPAAMTPAVTVEEEEEDEDEEEQLP